MSENQKAFRGYRDDQIGIGNEGNTANINYPGVYYDPASEKELEVFHTAAADALVRMGWVEVEFEQNPDGTRGERIGPKGLGRRPEDDAEVIALRQQLAEAQAALKKQAKEPKTPKPKKQEGKA